MDWTDDADSRVDIAATALADIRGVLRLGGGRQLTRFLLVGAVSTAAYVLLYLALRAVLPALAANALSQLVTALASTAVNRRFTFGISGRQAAARHQARGLIAFAAGLLLTSGALAALHALQPHPARVAEVTVLVVANLAATALRYLLYRSWVFAGPMPPQTRAPAAQAREAGR
ncbi:MAG: GtrA family protein [Streptosporangiaceae bacterium]